MQHPKTTISGIFLLISAVALVAAHAMSGSLSFHDMQHLLEVIAGIGLIAAADGKSGSTPSA